MKDTTITVRGRSTDIKYEVIQHINLVFARVLFKSGEEILFYQGMYGNKERWESKSMPDDLVEVLSAIFNSVEPIKFSEGDINLDKHKTYRNESRP